MSEPRIRPLVICVFHYRGRILVQREFDPVKKQEFYRPLGGGIEFGETSVAAIQREIREELSLEATSLRLIGTLDNIFTYAGRAGHEIVQVFDGEFDDRSVYERPYLDGFETGFPPFKAYWLDRSQFTGTIPLYPDGLFELLTTQSLL
jgi:8-oxo-dGTP pyrophosphatase MutT (NUDIX family)